MDKIIQISYNGLVLSQTTEYALRAVVMIAQNEGASTAQEISGLSHVPVDYLSKVMNQLTRAGILHAQRGRGGGFTLAVAPDRLTVLDVVNAVDPIRRIRSCPLGLRAHAVKMCALHSKLDKALAMVEEAFRSTSIASLCESPNEDALCQEDNYVAISSH